ncbi:MAG: HD-GYP domain-containing protein [Bryobacteraceae bacterium]
MRFATRTFLWSFVPFAFLLLGSFAAIQWMVQATVHERLRTSLRETHTSIARVRSRSELQNSRFLRIIGENASLKAGIELLAANDDKGARLTLEDQLFEICESLQFDFLMASDANGKPLAGIRRTGTTFAPLDVAKLQGQRQGILSIDNLAFQVSSIPVNQGEETIGLLTLGEQFDFSDFTTPAILTNHGRVVKSSIAGIPSSEVETALHSCTGQGECEIHLRGQTYLSLPLESIYFGDGWTLRSLQNVDSAVSPVAAILRKVFLVAAIFALAAALAVGILSSRSIVQPIARVVSHLQLSENTGVLPEFDGRMANIREIDELTASFNRAASAIVEARASLQRAYVEFVGALAGALDARDRYTAGHSRRVSEYSVELGKALQLAAPMLDQIRIGALLHDIGKIGIPDSVLQKPGKLTPEEYALIQQHPGIGRRILEVVQGFEPFLHAVELHHENWDGSGYPLGLSKEAVPLDARIVHIADAYDAMTSDRPYRPGMAHEEAIRIITCSAGTQFDPNLVAVFAELEAIRRPAPGCTTAESLQNLAQSVKQEVPSEAVFEEPSS